MSRLLSRSRIWRVTSSRVAGTLTTTVDSFYGHPRRFSFVAPRHEMQAGISYEPRRFFSEGIPEEAAKSEFSRRYDEGLAALQKGSLSVALSEFDAAYKSAVEFAGASSRQALLASSGTGIALFALGRAQDSLSWLRETFLEHHSVLESAALSAPQPGHVHPIAIAVDGCRTIAKAAVALGDRVTAASVMLDKTIPLIERATAAGVMGVSNQQQVLDDLRCAAASSLAMHMSAERKVGDSLDSDHADAGRRGVRLLKKVVDDQAAREPAAPLYLRLRAVETMLNAVAEVEGDAAALATAESEAKRWEADSTPRGAIGALTCALAAVGYDVALFAGGNESSDSLKLRLQRTGMALLRAESFVQAIDEKMCGSVAVEVANDATSGLLKRASIIDMPEEFAVFAESVEAFVTTVVRASILSSTGAEQKQTPAAVDTAVMVDDHVIKARLNEALALHHLQTAESMQRCINAVHRRLLPALRHTDSTDDPAPALRAYTMLGSCYSGLEKHEAAMSAFQSATSIARSAFGPTDRTTASVALQLVRALAAAGRPTEALTVLTRVVRPGFADIAESEGRANLLADVDSEEAALRDTPDAALPSAEELASISTDEALAMATPQLTLNRLHAQVGEQLQSGGNEGVRATLAEVFAVTRKDLPTSTAAHWMQLARAVSSLSRIDQTQAASESSQIISAWRDFQREFADFQTHGFVDVLEPSPASVGISLEAQHALLSLGSAVGNTDAVLSAFDSISTQLLPAVDAAQGRRSEGTETAPRDRESAPSTLPAESVRLLYNLSSLVKSVAANAAGVMGGEQDSALAKTAAEVGLGILERLVAISTLQNGAAARETLILRITAATDQMTVRGNAERALKELSEACVDATEAHGAASIEVLVSKLRVANVLATAGVFDESLRLLEGSVLPGLDQHPAAKTDALEDEQHTVELVRESQRAAKVLHDRVKKAVQAEPKPDSDRPGEQ